MRQKKVMTSKICTTCGNRSEYYAGDEECQDLKNSTCPMCDNWSMELAKPLFSNWRSIGNTDYEVSIKGKVRRHYKDGYKDIKITMHKGRKTFTILVGDDRKTKSLNQVLGEVWGVK